MRRAASLESQQQLPDEGAHEARSPSDPARVVDASSPDAPKALKVQVLNSICRLRNRRMMSCQHLAATLQS